MAAHAATRFSLLLLEPGEIYFDDFSAALYRYDLQKDFQLTSDSKVIQWLSDTYCDKRKLPLFSTVSSHNYSVQSLSVTVTPVTVTNWLQRQFLPFPNDWFVSKLPLLTYSDNLVTVTLFPCPSTVTLSIRLCIDDKQCLDMYCDSFDTSQQCRTIRPS